MGEWILVKREPGHRYPTRVNVKWLCQCSCGAVRLVEAHALTAGSSTSCGHHRQVTDFKPGTRIGEWELLEYQPGRAKSKDQARESPKWLCRCSCGHEAWVQTNNLRRGASLSCGHGRVRFKFQLHPEELPAGNQVT